MWGLQIFNDSGVIQIDDQQTCLHAVASGTATPTNRHAYALLEDSCRWIEITWNTAGVPFLALDIQPPLIGGVERFSRSGNEWRFRVVVAGPPPAVASAQFNWWIFDQPAPANGGWGLEVYRDDGSVAFTSRHPAMRVLGPSSQAYTGRGPFAFIGTVEWQTIEDIDTEDGQRFTYHWAYILGGAQVTNAGVGRIDRVVAEQWGEGASGLPNREPASFASNRQTLVLKRPY